MNYIKPAHLKGHVKAPASKSMMIRAIAAATLAHGKSTLLNPTYSEDADAALNVARALGANVKAEDSKLTITGYSSPIESDLTCGESGLCMRMFTSIASTFGKEFMLSAEGSLQNRPMNMMVETLQNLGVTCNTTCGKAPIHSIGKLKGGTITVDASTTSQFLSGLLMALPVCESPSEVIAKNLKSKPYILMTLSLLNSFGIQIEHDESLQHFVIPGQQEYMPSTYHIEGDWSAAAFMLVAGVIATAENEQVVISNLDYDSEQADRRILDALNLAGAHIEVQHDSLVIRRQPLHAFEFDATDCPDLFPPLTALAPYCEGTTTLIGAERLIHKESNRAEALTREFSKIGAKIQNTNDSLVIKGGPLKGGEADSHQDHRIAMACSIAALGSEKGVTIDNETCVAKSYPDFYRDLASLEVNP